MTHFNIWLTGTGWAEITLANSIQNITFEFSYLSDPLPILFLGLKRLINDESVIEKVIFADEPGEYILVLRKKELDLLEIELFRSDLWEEIAIPPTPITTKKIIYSEVDNLENVIRIVCKGINDLLNRTSIEEYNEKWSLFEFPVDAYTELLSLSN